MPTARPGRVLVTEQELRARVGELGQQIARDYERDNPVMIGVLQGAFLFMSDLIRAAPIDLTTDFIGVSSYGVGTKSSGHVRLVSDLSMSIEGRHVVLVEDIVDTGLTLAYLKRNLEARHPKSLRVCVLADKIDYVVNGTVVHSTPKTGMTAKTDGIAGLRVNHQLEVHIDNFAVTK